MIFTINPNIATNSCSNDIDGKEWILSKCISNSTKNRDTEISADMTDKEISNSVLKYIQKEVDIQIEKIMANK